jgi:hypothetical protein
MTDTCEMCKFFVPEKLSNGKGTCRAGRPSVQMFIVPVPPSPIQAPGQPNAQIVTHGAWPPVMRDNWCGEYARKLDA